MRKLVKQAWSPTNHWLIGVYPLFFWFVCFTLQKKKVLFNQNKDHLGFISKKWRHKKILRFLDRQVAVEVTCNAAISACENSVEWMQVPEWRAGTGSGTWFLERDFSSKEINSIFQVSLFCVKFQGGIYIWYNRILKMAIDQNFILQSSFVLGAALFWTLFAPGSRVSSMFLDVDSQGSSSRNMLIVTGI